MQIQLCQFCDPTDRYLPSNHIVKLSTYKDNALYQLFIIVLFIISILYLMIYSFYKKIKLSESKIK